MLSLPIYQTPQANGWPTYMLTEQPGTYRLARIPEDIWQEVGMQLGLRIGLRDGQALPIRTLLLDLGIKVGPDAEVVAFDYLQRSVLVAWRA